MSEPFDVEEEDNDDDEDNNEEISEKLSPPEVNSVFDSEVEVYEYYKRYGKQNGFGITIRNTRKIDGVNTYLTVACHRYGNSHWKVVDSLNPKPVGKSNCKVRLCAKRMDDGKWNLHDLNILENAKLGSEELLFSSKVLPFDSLISCFRDVSKDLMDVDQVLLELESLADSKGSS
ncbi:hypothetical protein ACET3Z_031300 [Daucus carota]